MIDGYSGVDMQLRVSFLSRFDPRGSRVTPDAISTEVRLMPEPRPTKVTRDEIVSVPRPGTFGYSSGRACSSIRGPN